MRASADGAQTGYALSINRNGKQPPGDWRHRKHRKCCDEHAAAEDNRVEFEWSRQGRAGEAHISVVTFAESASTPVERATRKLFVSVARAAADDCLELRGPSGGAMDSPGP
jgi:hypothetical protein